MDKKLVSLVTIMLFLFAGTAMGQEGSWSDETYQDPTWVYISTTE